MLFTTLNLALTTTALLQSPASAKPIHNKPECATTDLSVPNSNLETTITKFCDKDAGRIVQEPVGYLDTSGAVRVQMTMLTPGIHKHKWSKEQCKQAFQAIVAGCPDDNEKIPASKGGSVIAKQLEYHLTLADQVGGWGE